MKYAVEMGSGAIMYIASFIKTGSGIQKLMGKIHRHRQHKPTFILFQNKENRLKKAFDGRRFWIF
jgi:hypothetical protein